MAHPDNFPFKGVFTGPMQVYIRLVAYFINFKRLLRDNIGVLILKEWKHIEKENIVPVDETMLPEILRIQAKEFDDKSQETLLKYSKKLRKIFYILRDQNRVAGYCIYYLKPEISFRGLKKKAVIYSIAVDNKFRGMDYGRRLLEESIKEMKANGVFSILLYVNVNNIPAIRLYEKMGFQTIKMAEDVCGQKGKCYVMELKLI